MYLDQTKVSFNVRFVLQESVGIRLNQEPPHIYFKQKKTGGISFTATVNLTRMDEKMVQLILHEYKVLLLFAIVKESKLPLSLDLCIKTKNFK